MDLPPLRIIYEDNHCLAIDKPAGALTTHYQGDEETLDRQVKAYLKEKYQKPGNVFLGIVQRLDRPVSGVLLFARTSKAAARIAAQFRAGTVEKVYWAIVADRPLPESAKLEDWLRKDREIGRVLVVPPNTPEARHASLEYTARGHDRSVTWLELRPHTGRSHQLRVQLASRAHPIYGDRKYGSARAFASGIALHARSLAFQHPVRQERIVLTAELPPAWLKSFPRLLKGGEC